MNAGMIATRGQFAARRFGKLRRHGEAHPLAA
jgi:hypothetical protein